MVLDSDLLAELLRSEPDLAWSRLVTLTLQIASQPLDPDSAVVEVGRREREIAQLDNALSGAAWELWRSFPVSVQRTSEALCSWWDSQGGGKAVLILDALSLRELPWLLQGAEKRGFTLHGARACGSELPGETTPFARALGLQSRSQLQNNGGGSSHRLAPARSEAVDLAWPDCQALVDSSPEWLFWHHWPDSKLHQGSGPGYGLELFTGEAMEQLDNEEFWQFVSRLATGRRLVITSDHGYAATGGFSDAGGELGKFLKGVFAGGRSAAGSAELGPYVPPVALRVDSDRGPQVMAVGRRKWKNQGGYPTLTHGGLTLLEVLSPFLEISK